MSLPLNAFTTVLLNTFAGAGARAAAPWKRASLAHRRLWVPGQSLARSSGSELTICKLPAV